MLKKMRGSQLIISGFLSLFLGIDCDFICQPRQGIFLLETALSSRMPIGN
jgi:hypothetical protein